MCRLHSGGGGPLNLISCEGCGGGGGGSGSGGGDGGVDGGGGVRWGEVTQLDILSAIHIFLSALHTLSSNHLLPPTPKPSPPCHE